MTSLSAMLVEDSEDDAELVLDALREGGLSVTARRVWSAPAMREALDAGPWDVVISDYSTSRSSSCRARWARKKPSKP
jgi:CheY-like chemotaxis protein